MKELKRKEGELWTSYLIRVLEYEGIKVPNFKVLTDNSIVTGMNNCFLDIERYITIKKGTEKYHTRKSLLESCLEEIAWVSIPPDNDIYYIKFLFLNNGNCLVGYEVWEDNWSLEGLLSKYKHNGVYDSEEVIHDLVKFAKNPYDNKIIEG